MSLFPKPCGILLLGVTTLTHKSKSLFLSLYKWGWEPCHEHLLHQTSGKKNGISWRCHSQGTVSIFQCMCRCRLMLGWIKNVRLHSKCTSLQKIKNEKVLTLYPYWRITRRNDRQYYEILERRKTQMFINSNQSSHRDITSRVYKVKYNTCQFINIEMEQCVHKLYMHNGIRLVTLWKHHICIICV